MPAYHRFRTRRCRRLHGGRTDPELWALTLTDKINDFISDYTHQQLNNSEARVRYNDILNHASDVPEHVQ